MPAEFNPPRVWKEEVGDGEYCPELFELTVEPKKAAGDVQKFVKACRQCIWKTEYIFANDDDAIAKACVYQGNLGSFMQGTDIQQGILGKAFNTLVNGEQGNALKSAMGEEAFAVVAAWGEYQTRRRLDAMYSRHSDNILNLVRENSSVLKVYSDVSDAVSKYAKERGTELPSVEDQLSQIEKEWREYCGDNESAATLSELVSNIGKAGTN